MFEYLKYSNLQNRFVNPKEKVYSNGRIKFWEERCVYQVQLGSPNMGDKSLAKKYVRFCACNTLPLKSKWYCLWKYYFCAIRWILYEYVADKWARYEIHTYLLRESVILGSLLCPLSFIKHLQVISSLFWRKCNTYLHIIYYYILSIYLPAIEWMDRAWALNLCIISLSIRANAEQVVYSLKAIWKDLQHFVSLSGLLVQRARWCCLLFNST